MTEVVLIPVAVVAVLLITAMAFAARYKTVGPDYAMIITGAGIGHRNVVADHSGNKVKIVRGGGAYVLPIFQRSEFISLQTHKLEVSTPQTVYTLQGVPILVDGVAIVKVGSTVEEIATAAEQFLRKESVALEAEAREVLEGHLRAILGSMTVEEVYRNRDKFAQEVQSVAALDLKKMGLQIVAFTIKDVRDPAGYLEALGRPRIAVVKREADIAEANAMRDARVQKALAEEEGMRAELERDTKVAEANKQKELQMAAFKKDQDTAKAEADQSYFIQEARSKQHVVEEQMKVEVVRRQREIELDGLEISRRERQFDADVKKKADAERYAVEQAAEAAKAKAMREADARKYGIETEAQANAERQRVQGTAEAEVIRMKGLAEAEAKEKIAEAFQKYGQAAVLDIIVKMLPELAARVAEPIGNIDKLTVVDTGNGAGAARVSNYVTSLMSTAPELLKSVAGIDLNALVGKLVGGSDQAEEATEAPVAG
ncbi:MAG: flotillin family protein [Bacteroidetes bacterium]|nr:flotillin family protein [Bacteroidota bacterium]